MALQLTTLGPGEDPEVVAEAALRHLDEPGYAAELRAAGASPVHVLAAVFDGKRAWVRARV